ncbi:MAG: phosphotransferase [Pseudomonadales bacterium]|jgi:aminoglycoside/choline kinase family phosphotransferase
MTNIPTPADLDVVWFGDRLREAGFAETVVTGVTRKQVGTGQIGTCYRYALTLERADPGVPTSFVAKFPSDDELSRATGVQLRNYYREVQFYRHLAGELGISVPRCYYADIEGEGPEFVLLLEDMAPAEQGDQLSGCEPDVARAAVLELVGLQAPSWCREDLKAYDWLTAEESARDAMSGLYAQLLPGFLDRYGHALAEDEREIIARVGRSPDCPLFQPVGTPFCLEHVDYRLDNMLIDHSRTPPRVTVVDWQSVRIGKPMNDVAYFLGAGLLPEDRRGVEEDIVRAYHRGLVEAGIHDYDWARCWEDYRAGAFAGFGVTVIASMIVQQTPRGDEMFITMARRHARHALDHGADEFLAP